jgi:hypothetical protein
MLTLATATPRHKTFFNWNLTVANISSTFPFISSLVWTTDGNFPHLVKKGPPNLANCLTRDSEMNNNLYFFAHFLSSFPFLSAGSILFFKVSASIQSIPASLHLSIWLASAITQTYLYLNVK